MALLTLASVPLTFMVLPELVMVEEEVEELTPQLSELHTDISTSLYYSEVQEGDRIREEEVA